VVVKKGLRAYTRKYFELRREKGGLSSQHSVQAPPEAEAPNQSEPAGSAVLTPAPPADPPARNVKQVAG